MPETTLAAHDVIITLWLPALATISSDPACTTSPPASTPSSTPSMTPRNSSYCACSSKTSA
jgi:hypothetical protein